MCYFLNQVSLNTKVKQPSRGIALLKKERENWISFQSVHKETFGMK